MQKVTSRNSLSHMDKSRNESSSRLANGSDTNSLNIQPTMDVNDWRRAISTPTKYRVGSASFHMRPRDLFQVIVVFLLIVTIVTLIYRGNSQPMSPVHVNHAFIPSKQYNRDYPLTPEISILHGRKLRIAIISDLDQASKVEGEKGTVWKSFFKKGYLTIFNNNTMTVSWDEKDTVLHSSMAQGGRGMELSELVVFDGKLITVDDRTGIVYKIIQDEVVPWVILSDGPGDVTKGFKSEWATVKDQQLYIGGLGKEWTSTKGEVLNINPQYVKRVSANGAVEHLDWHKHYNKMREAAGIHPPGYMVHESGTWSDVHQRWFFLPRRASKEKYDDALDERRAANIMLTCTADFSEINSRKFGPSSLTHGFSSFKFIPGTEDKYVLALKSEEDGSKIASYIMVFDLQGKLVMKETLIGNYKFEGVEFV